MKQAFLVFMLMALPVIGCLADDQVMDFSGSWGFRLDPDNAGIAAQWYGSETDQILTLPGCLQEQGYGNVPGPDTVWMNPVVNS
ncbi:hypothetical protein PDESU_01237 [Pontiella desulfatans]|uniref:Uncharacterized protein n=1 Tax=Pontiella desulfatans TaxID=2750659 RepID=A0A6C2TYZ3_PONDE|nr:hypothetical protein [Pontiella desulfatans]VGO12684.1 hypothetical protein PDESU_01237 [Pontiella desulfatans]